MEENKLEELQEAISTPFEGTTLLKSTRSNGKLISILMACMSVAIVWATLSTTAYIMRPERIVEVVTNDPGQVVFDLGDGRSITAPGDSILEFHGDIALDKLPTKQNRTDGSSGKGVEVHTAGSDGKFLLEIDFGSPETSIDGGASSMAGYANIGVKSVVSNGRAILYWIGTGLIVIGALMFFMIPVAKKIGMVLGGIGIGIIALTMLFETYPWVLLLFGLMLVAGLGVVIWDYWRNGKLKLTADAITAGIDQLPRKAKALVTTVIGEEARARGIYNTSKKVIQHVRENGGTPKSRVDTTKEEQDLMDDLTKRHGPIVNAPVTAPQVILVNSADGKIIGATPS